MLGPFYIMIWFFISGNLIRLLSPTLYPLLMKIENLKSNIKKYLKNVNDHSDQLVFYNNIKYEKEEIMQIIKVVIFSLFLMKSLF